MRKVIAVIIVVAFSVPTVFADSPEIAIKVDESEHGRVYVRTFSTEKKLEITPYDLYTIEKINGRWEKKLYVRTIDMPVANKERKGKYKYASEQYTITDLAWGHVYTLAPTRDNCHYSKPFWRKPLRRSNAGNP